MGLFTVGIFIGDRYRNNADHRGRSVILKETEKSIHP
jgi:hypothetical protein